MSDPVVGRYAEALFGAAQGRNETEAVAVDLEELALAFEGTGLRSFMENPRPSPESKRRLVEGVGRLAQSALTGRFLAVLDRKKRISILPEAAKEFRRLKLRAEGVSKCEVTLAWPAGGEFLEKLKARLERMTRGRVELEVRVDRSILGGIAIRIGNRLLDGTVRAHLERLDEYLHGGGESGLRIYR